MILAAVAVMVAVSGAQDVVAPQPDNPTSRDKSELRQVATKCHLHEGALYFIQYKEPSEPVIHMTRALGDTEAQEICVLQNLPKDFSTRFGIDTVMPPKP